MNFIDSHGHICHEYYENDFAEVLQRAINAQVTQIILPCVSSKSIDDIIQVSTEYPQHLFPLIGLHPTEVPEDYETELTKLKKYLTHPHIVGIGEIGLDFYHDQHNAQEQKLVFQRQLEWAVDMHLPVSLHIRSAYAEAFEILKPFQNCGLTGILHCFSGGIQEAEWAIRFGFLLGIGGVVTFKNNKLKDIVKTVGIEHIALETDCPFLAPTPYRGQRNESSYIPLIAQVVADILECPLEKVAQTTTHNVRNIFTRIQ